MKKFILFIIIFGMMVSFGTSALADIEEKVSNHWSKTLIDEGFFVHYFPYLAKENFKYFEPNGVIYEDQFLLSFSSLLEDNGYPKAEIGSKKELTRSKMAKVIGKKLMEIELIQSDNKKLPFADIGDISVDEQNGIACLYHLGIIYGESKTIYNPGRNVTQAEAIIVLQRVNELLDKKINIPFKLAGVVQTYSGKEGISSKIEGDKVLVTITKECPTPGYSIEVEEILKSKRQCKIKLNIIQPSGDSDQLQVITYKIMTIEIDKEHMGNPPYNFVLEDFFLK